MDVEPAVFESDNKPIIVRYGLAAGAVCFGFWFFDYVMRGWFGGTPNLAVSLRHTFIIAICLVFVVGFLLKDRFQRIALGPDGLELLDSSCRVQRMAWNEIAHVTVESHRIVCRSHENKTIAIAERLSDPEGFVNKLVSLAGPDHILTKAAKQAFEN